MGLRIGLFTPTEAGAMTVLYALVVGAFIYRELKSEHLPPIILESVLSTAAIMLIIAAASAFGYYLSWERIPQQVTAFLIGVSANPWVFLLIVNLFLLFCGMFMDGGALLIILTPLLLPVAKQLGIDPVHFGIVMIVNLVIGGVTPPFGTMMFLTCALLKVKIADFAREGLIFILALIAVLFLITYIPSLVTVLPHLFAAK
jgi:tripartite ATP-independent transporter DctM subunit